jgi:hypothetical protein
MYRIFVVTLLSFTAAALGVAGLDLRAACADGRPVATATSPAGAQDESALARSFFHVQWTAGRAPAGRTRISGFVYNDFGDTAVNVALRIHRVDGSGREVASTLVPIGQPVPGLGRSYFDVRVPDSHAYRVDVTSFDFVELPG